MARKCTTSCPQRHPDNSAVFAAEATAITPALDYYQHMDRIKHDVVVYPDSSSGSQVIDGEDTEKPLICHIMNPPWSH